MPGLRVLADRERLSQIVENLLLNAARHGAPPVRLRAVAADEQVRIEVRDSGSRCGGDGPDRASSSGS